MVRVSVPSYDTATLMSFCRVMPMQFPPCLFIPLVPNRNVPVADFASLEAAAAAAATTADAGPAGETLLVVEYWKDYCVGDF